MAKKKSKATPWEIAKPILLKAYLEGKVTDDMAPIHVHQMKEHPEFQAVKYDRFRDKNFAALKRRVGRFKKHSEDHEALLIHDLTIYKLSEDTEGCWNGSEAQRLLERDIKKGRHLKYKPEVLWIKRDAYQQFSLTTFRGHIHQIRRREKETPYWTYKKAKKKADSFKKRERDDEDDLIAYVVQELG